MDALTPIDWTVIAVYFLAVLGIGLWAGGRQHSAREYFLGGRSLPWWAATLSIVATETSAVTYIGIPAASFGGNWNVLQLVLGLVLGRFFLAYVFVSVFYREEYLTVYGFLSDRFGRATRFAAAIMFLLGRLVASGIRLYAGCLAFNVATGESIGVWPSIVTLGIIGTILAYSGGIRSVVWTDVILGFTLIAGGVVAAWWLVGDIPGGLDAVTASLDWREKTTIVSRFFGDLGTDDSLVAGVLGGFVLTLATHGTDQDIAQRILTCRDASGGRRSVIGSAVLIVPLFALFLLVGTLLYYQQALGTPGYSVPDDRNGLFPRFIVSSLPTGLAGFVMAGLLAAALSSYTSALNALAATTVGDVLGVRDDHNGPRAVRISRWVTLGCAALLIGTAISFVDSQENVFDLAIRAFSYFYGALLGLFLLGILTRRGTDLSALIGAAVGVASALLLQLREFAESPQLAPSLVAGAVQAIPESVRQLVVDVVPEIGSRYWIVVGAALTVSIGAFGVRSSAKGAASSPRSGTSPSDPSENAPAPPRD